MSRKTAMPVLAAPDGAVMVNAGRYARQATLTAFEMIGGVQRLAEWADENPGEFFTKIFTKTIQRDVEVDIGEGIEAHLAKLDEFDDDDDDFDDDDTIDAEYEVVDDD